MLILWLLALYSLLTAAQPITFNSTSIETLRTNNSSDASPLGIPLSFQITLQRTNRAWWKTELPKSVTANFEYNVARVHSRENRAQLVSIDGKRPSMGPISLRLEYDDMKELKFGSDLSSGKQITLPGGLDVHIDFVYVDIKLDLANRKFVQLILGEHHDREIYESPRLNPPAGVPVANITVAPANGPVQVY